MVIEARPRLKSTIPTLGKKTQVTVFHCINALSDLDLTEYEGSEIRSIKLPCSSLLRELVLLKAFESGADAVVVLACPEGSCHYLQGNLRAVKRVARVKKLLDEIGLGGHRLNLYNIPHGNQQAAEHIIRQTVSEATKAREKEEEQQRGNSYEYYQYLNKAGSR
jgi:F420-non-reducing hydrogenase iron-sulfur subunit